jgi:hypothetical protein
MRKFIAGCCCLIVGLEVLICIPLAVVAAYVYGQATASPTLVMQTQASTEPIASSVSYTTPPYTSSSSPYSAPSDSCNSCNTAGECQPLPATSAQPKPLAYAPSALPATGYDPYVQAPPQVSVSPAPATIPRITLPESPMPLALNASTSSYPPAASVAPADSVASTPAIPVASYGASGTVSDEVEPPPPAEPTENQQAIETAAADATPSREEVQQLLSDWQRLWSAAGVLPHLAANMCCNHECELANCEVDEVAAAKAAQDELVASLHETVKHLYGEAGRCEERYDFEQADRLRKMARELRTEAMDMQQRRHAAENGQPLHGVDFWMETEPAPRPAPTESPAPTP